MAETKPIKPAALAPELAIIHPEEGHSLRPDRPLHLWGTSTGRAEPASVEWNLDSKKVAEGLDAWAKTPKAGKHEAEISAKGASR